MSSVPIICILLTLTDISHHIRTSCPANHSAVHVQLVIHCALRLTECIVGMAAGRNSMSN